MKCFVIHKRLLLKQQAVAVIITIMVCCFSFTARAQVITEKQKQKLSPLLREDLVAVDSEKTSFFMIVVKDPGAFSDFLSAQPSAVRTILTYSPGNIFLIRARWGEVLDKFLKSDLVIFVDEKRTPKEELAVSGYDLSVNKVNRVHNEFPEWNGDSIVVSVMEDKMDTTDIDFIGRYESTGLSSSVYSSHASIMATMIAGGGNTFFEGKGVAWGATITSSSFSTLLPDADAAYQEYKISVQNHSYGTGIENFYGADAAAYDASAINNPSLMHIFSAGNSGNMTSILGPYEGIENYANITGSFKMAKNIITVGATDSFSVVAALSSRGPAYDGRVKPELVAFGQDGSSGAAAVVSGISLLLQQAYKQEHSGMLPASALVKAILLNSADDVAAESIDYVSGYGSANGYKAMKTLLAEDYISGNMVNNGSQSYNLLVPAGIHQLKVTLVWNDVPAEPNASSSLINDLDLELQLPAASQSWKPWVLSGFPDKDSLALPPVRKRDSLNNAEQITIDDPVAGDYLIDVAGFNVVSDSQDFFIAWQIDSSETFNWCFPGRDDNIFPGDLNVIRWESNFSGVDGQLEFSTDGMNWSAVNNAVDLTTGYVKWLAPDTFSTGLLRMNINSQHFYSDTFTISQPLNTFVGFNCTDSFMYYWNKTVGIANYQLYELGDKYLEPFLITTDTVAVLDKASHPSLHYTVAPLIANKTAVKSYTFDYTTQGVGCYIKTFSVQLVDNSFVMLDLELGSTWEINKIIWEKLTLSGYVPLDTITYFPGTEFSYTDVSPTHGENTYRVTFELNDGEVIYGQPETVYFLNENSYWVYPDPASQSEEINIIAKEAGDAVIRVFNTGGQVVMESKMDDVLFSIPAGKLSIGFYVLRITGNNIITTSLKLVVY